MNRTRIQAAAALAATAALSMPAHAVIVGIATGGNPMQVPGIISYADGEVMALRGMSVTASFAGGGIQTVPWLVTGAQSGAATGNGWRLSQIGDTYTPNSLPWQLVTTVPLTGLLIDGRGGVIFDRTDPAPGTPGSALGLDISDVVAPPPPGVPVVRATYLDAVFLPGQNPLLDTWGRLDLEFVQGAFAGNWDFQQDTDVVIPLPASLPLFISALALGGNLLRRRSG